MKETVICEFTGKTINLEDAVYHKDGYWISKNLS